MDNLGTSRVNIQRQFFNSLKRGTGEAYLIARNNPTVDFSNYIIKGALKNFAYDGQSEGSRAKYIYDLILLSTQQDKIRKAILKGLATERQDAWTLTQLFNLAKIYAKQGNTEARKAIYKRFCKKVIFGTAWAGYDDIIELDGFEGLKYIAETFGKALEKNPDRWQDRSIIDSFQDDNKSINVMAELEREGKANKYIRLYLDSVNETEQNRKSYIRPTTNFQKLLEEVGSYRYSYIRLRHMKLSQEEIALIANCFLTEKEGPRKEQLLCIFSQHKFPFDYQPILKLAKRKPSSKLSEFAIDALKNIKAEDIRQFALDKIEQAKRPAVFTDILISNYKKGDHVLLKSIVDKYRDEHIIENLAFSYVAIFKANATKECKEPLEALYNKMTCGIHRNHAVKILLANGVLSKKIKEEIKYDSYEEMRELLNGEKKA
jgi:hypothetical protein